MRRLALSRTACFTSQIATYWTSLRPRNAPRSPLPWLPMPMPAITTRSLGVGRPSAPRTEAGTTEGRAMSAAEAFKNERRVMACEGGLFVEAIFLQLFVNFLQRGFCFVAPAAIRG